MNATGFDTLVATAMQACNCHGADTGIRAAIIRALEQQRTFYVQQLQNLAGDGRGDRGHILGEAISLIGRVDLIPGLKPPGR